MSIYLKSSTADTDSQKRKTSGIELVLLPQPQRLYLLRQQRLHELAQHSELRDYLLFAAQIARAQHQIQHNHPFNAADLSLTGRLHNAGQRNRPALDLHYLNPGQHWQHLLNALICQLEPELTGKPASVLALLKATSEAVRWHMAQALLSYQFSSALSDKAPFIWAALSVCWAQMAGCILEQVQHDEARQFCPICGCVPVAGIIQSDTRQGLRYLQCALCETRWHLVRVKCSNCEQTRTLSYWSIDNEQAPIKCETCDDCGSYLKLFYLNRLPQQEPVADDLASLILDLHMEQKGYARSAFNPLLFPAESQTGQQQKEKQTPAV